VNEPIGDTELQRLRSPDSQKCRPSFRGELWRETRRHILQAQRFSSTHVGFERFIEFSTLFYFLTAYELRVSPGDDWICTVMNMELLQFYYSAPSTLQPRFRFYSGLHGVAYFGHDFSNP